MLPQFGFAEILIVAMIALIVVGPKDLPVMMRRAGQFFARIKSMGQEFKDAFNQMGEDEDIAALKREIEELKAMGKIEGLGGEDFADEMRETETALREGTDLTSPKTAKPEGEAKDDG